MMKEKIGNCFPYIKNGLNIKQDKNKGGIPITRIETLSNDRFNRDKMGYADIFDVEKYSDRILCDGDILMSHINSSRYLGRAVLYQKQNNENIIHGVNLLRLKADRSIVYPNYAAKFFASRYFKKQVVSITKKAVNQASFSIAALKELEIQLPDLDTQKRIAQNFEKISNCIFTLEEYLNKLDDLVKSLISGTAQPQMPIRSMKTTKMMLPPLFLQQEFAAFVHQVDKLKFDFDFLVSFSIPSICLFCLKLDP